ncbi:MAG: HlyD family efflux transporter periplasmic adaptor subunit [Bacteroidia bacterium]|nr:HlyD family efflux transporter periplasmic adaptor subunit [Bacteroidia bacterium]
MKTGDPNIELRQEEIQEILGVVPPWVIRWGSLALAIVFIGLIVGTIWFKYPDRIVSQLTLTTLNPPVVMNARQNGRIELLTIGDTSTVRKGQLLAVLESSARITDILEVDSLMVNYHDLLANPDSIGLMVFPQKDYQFGEWQTSLAAFSKARKDLNDFNIQGSNQARIQSLRKQQKDYKLLYDRQYRQRQIKSEEMDLQEKQYQRLVALRDSNAISLKEFESGSSIYLKAKYDLESTRSTLSQTQIQIDQLDHEIIGIDKDYLEVRDQKSNLLTQSFDQLAGTVSNWKLNYAFIAPIDGTVTFTRVWSQNQYVKQGDRVLTIISGEPGPVLGKVLLPLRGAGKVKAGQKVIVRIDKYPYMEYGSLQGVVESISMVSDQEFYSVEISFPDRMTTTYKKELVFSQGMSGQAEIITEEFSLLVRIVNPLRSILKRNSVLKT